MAYQSVHSSSQILQRFSLSRSMHTQPSEIKRHPIHGIIEKNRLLRGKSQPINYLNRGNRKPSLVRYLKSKDGKSPEKYYDYLLEGNLSPKLQQLNPSSIEIIKTFSTHLKSRNQRLPRIAQQILRKSHLRV